VITKKQLNRIITELNQLKISGGGRNRQPTRAPKGKARRRKNKTMPMSVIQGLSKMGVYNNISRQPKLFREFTKQGTMVISNEEPFMVLTGGGQESQFNPGQTGMVMLDNLAAQYDQYKIRSCQIIYRPGVGTTVNGGIVAGIDYNPQTDSPTDNSFAAVAILEPKLVIPVWGEGAMTVDVARAMKGNTWRFTNNSGPSGTAFILRNNTDVTGSTYGKLWCKYTVEYCSPKPISGSSAINAPTSRTAVEVASVSNGIHSDLGIINTNTSVVNFTPLTDPFDSGNANVPNTTSVELDMPMPPCPSGTVTTVNVLAPTYSFQASLNASPPIIILDNLGNDITANFVISSGVLTAGPVSALGNVTGLWAWAVTAIVPIASEYLVKIVTTLFQAAANGVNTYFLEGTATQSLVPAPVQQSLVNSPTGLGQALVTVGSSTPTTINVSNMIIGVSVTPSVVSGNTVLLFSFSDPSIDMSGRYIALQALGTTFTGVLYDPTISISGAVDNANPTYPTGYTNLGFVRYIGGGTGNFTITMSQPTTNSVTSLVVTLIGPSST